MTTVRIVLNEALPAFRPGEILEGRVEWEGMERLDPLDLRLCWSPTGAYGPEIVREELIDLPAPQGSHPFRLELPGEPWSFEGKLFSIEWRIDVSRDNGELVRAGFILSPTGQALRPRD